MKKCPPFLILILLFLTACTMTEEPIPEIYIRAFRYPPTRQSIFEKSPTDDSYLQPQIRVVSNTSTPSAGLSDIRELLVEGPDHIKKWGAGRLTVKVKLKDGRIAGVRASKISYTSANPQIVSVQGNGILIGQNEGKTHITITVSEIQQNIFITVDPPLALLASESNFDSSVKSITVQPDNVTLGVGETQTLKATVTMQDGSQNQDIEWYSSEPFIVTVDDRGTLKRLASGSVTITALAVSDARKQLTVQVNDQPGGPRMELDETLILDGSQEDGFNPGGTASEPESTPTVPQGLRTGTATQTGFTLSWNSVSGASSYQVYQDGISIASNLKTTSYTVNGLSDGNTYHFQVSAMGADGIKSLKSGKLYVTFTSPGGKEITTPVAPTGLSATSVTDSSTVLSWTAVSDASSYKVYKNGNIIASNLVSTSFIVPNLVPNTSFNLQVSAVNNGVESEKSTALNILTAPVVPTGLNKSNLTNTSFNLSWNPSQGASSYKVYKDGILFADNVTTTAKAITGLNVKQTYAMAVSAVNSGGESNKSTVLNVLAISDTIAFVADTPGEGREIYTMNADGTNQNNLTLSPGENLLGGDTAIIPPSIFTTSTTTWSPDKSKILFVSNRTGNAEITIMDTDGSNQTNLSNNGAGEGQPSWSPDGTKIVFFSDRDGNSEIYVMNTDGSAQTRLTNTAGGDYFPVWSPDGTKIAFLSDRDGNAEIYTMNSDGSNQTRLTNNTASENSPTWSPDGSKILFVSGRDGNQEIYTMNADGSNPVNLTQNPATDENGLYGTPHWSPDGTRILFVSDRDGNQEIYIMNTNGSNQIRLTNALGVDNHPVWSPDGSQIAFVSNRDGNQEIYTMNVDGSNPVNLTNNPRVDNFPVW